MFLSAAAVVRMSTLRVQSNRRRARWAFSVIELMLAIAIMGVIVYALYSVFNQTQRALRRSETETDVAQRARLVVEMIGKEIEQAQPSFGFWLTNNAGVPILTNEINLKGGFEWPPKVQRVADRPDLTPRTNYLQNIFFYNNRTNAWQGIGYRVIYVTNGVGVLQRFETNQFGHRPIFNRLSRAFDVEPLTNLTYRHVADGVIHLTFVPYDDAGRRLGWDTTNRAPSQYQVLRRRADGSIVNNHSDTNVTSGNLHQATVELRAGEIQNDLNLQYGSTFNFRSNAMPSYIEMELGILEPEALAQFYTMVEDQNPNATNFLARQIGKVHLFRQRIPIRTAAQ